MKKRFAQLVWKGTGKEGAGHFTTESRCLNNTLFNYQSRFEDGPGTNPEELLAAAHAGCFTMKIAFLVNAKGFTADSLDTKCEISMGGGSISASHLNLKARIPGISKEDFDAVVKEAAEKCMVTVLFNAPTTYEAVLEG
jgi:osmotically inducible protein OsmC